jgi:hypothetical protein
VPLTLFQQRLPGVLSQVPVDDRYLAGGAALHFAPHSARYSDDLDFFHDSEAQVASAFARDRALLDGAGYAVAVELLLAGQGVVPHFGAPGGVLPRVGGEGTDWG